MGFRFVHMADVHLDTPFQNRDGYLREVLGNCLKGAFSAAIDLAIDRNAHALLIAGDLFDDDTLSYRTVKFLSKEIHRLEREGIEVFYTPGNHDPAIRRAKAPTIKWAKNVHIFSSSEPEAVPVLDQYGQPIAYVVGAGHERRVEERNLAKRFPRAIGDIPHIGLLHCLMIEGEGASGHERYAPCTRWDLEEKGYDYWALGHIHRRIEYNEGTRIVYPGNISGRNFRETGIKGAYYVEIDDYGGIESEFVPLSKALWLDIDIKGLQDIEDWISFEGFLEKKLGQRLAEEFMLSDGIEVVIARLNLKGRSPMYSYLMDEEEIEMLEEDIGSDLGIESLIIDKNAVYPNIDAYRYGGGPHLASYVLNLIDEAKGDDELLLSLTPEPIAGGFGRGHDQDDVIEYLKQLLDDMEYEALSYLIEEESHEI